jgi:hypothetical protein
MRLLPSPHSRTGRALASWWAFALGLALVGISVVMAFLTEKQRHVEVTHWHGVTTAVKEAHRWDHLVNALQLSGFAVIAVWCCARRKGDVGATDRGAER